MAAGGASRIDVRPRARPRQRSGGGARIRWEHLGRIALVCTLGALLYLYLSAGLSVLATRNEISQNRSQLESMEREHERLVREHRALVSPGRVQEEARLLGMKREGEQVYDVSGLPSN